MTKKEIPAMIERPDGEWVRNPEIDWSQAEPETPEAFNDADPKTPVLDFRQEIARQELEFLAEHCHKLNGNGLSELGTGTNRAFGQLLRFEGYDPQDVPF